MTTKARILLDRNADWITSRRGFFSFIVAVLAALALLRSFLFPGVGGDDGEQLVFAQFFSWGYQVRNPPLVTWLLIGVQSVLGPSVLSIVAIRAFILFAIYGLSYGVARRLGIEARLATLSAGSLLMIFYAGWNTIHGFTHTSLVTASYLAALLLVLIVRDGGGRGWLFGLGLVLGLGPLAKYSFVIFALALAAAALWEPTLRRRLMSPWLVAGFLVAMPLVVPQAQWLIAHAPPGHIVRGETDPTLWEDVRHAAKGIFRLLTSILTFPLPLAVIWLALFWRAVRRPPVLTPDQAASARLLIRLFGGLVVLGAVAVVVAHADRLRSHYLFILVPLVPYVFLRYGAAFRALDIRRYAACVTLAGVALVASLVGKYVIEPLVCGHCEDHIPYDDFAGQLRAAGFTGGTIFAYFHRDPLAGNLRVRFPESRTVSAKHPGVIPPARQAAGQCLLIWPVRGAVDPKTATIKTANLSALETGIAEDHPARRLTAMLPPYGKTPHQLDYILLEDGAGACR